MAIKINIEELEKEFNITFEMNIRSALNGDLMIMEHKDIDIIIKQKDNKVIAFPKDIMSDLVYGAESRMLEFLRKQGIIEYDSIQGGNVYGSMEGTIMESEKLDSIKATLVSLSEWFKTEQSYIAGTTAYDAMQDDALLEPDKEESTELGEVPAEAEKGSITQNNLFAPYLYGRYSYE
jgi:hypothetical protein|tara:strand:- start:106 stop:639 length:534 start_codon:yes stop_codon:yes gene_type:complete